MFNRILKLGELTVPHAIIQGGMAVRISTASLAGAIASQGGIGVIAGTAMTSEELRDEIIQAKRLAGRKGAIGINVLFAVKNFADLIRTALKTGIDIVFSGAGFSRDVFSWGKQFNVPVLPLVSSGRLAKIAEKLGAAAVVAESCQAGGHLGTNRPIEEILPEVKAATNLPVIAAGGIVDGYDIYRMEQLGADGVQMGTRFAASRESNASEYFKQLYVNSKAADSVLIKSPVGLQGRALRNAFVDKLLSGATIEIEACDDCLKKCNRNFCIKKALENAQKGRGTNRLVFAGQKVYAIKEILSVKEIFDKLKKEYDEARSSKKLNTSLQSTINPVKS